MPSVTWSFSVELTATNKPSFATCVHTPNLDLFKRILELGFPEISQRPLGTIGAFIKVQATEDDPMLRAALDLLARAGHFPSDHQIAPLGECDRYFRIRKERKYNKPELDQSEYLCLCATVPWRIIATAWSANPTSDWTVVVDYKQRGQSPLGTFDCFPGILVSEPVKALMEPELENVRFVEVQYDKPEAVTKRLWKFDSERKMPRCLLRRQNMEGELLPKGELMPDPRLGGYWDEGGYIPPELVFNGSEVATIEPFDVAVTQEMVGDRTTLARPEVIVSQRFRELMERKKLKGVTYAPVRLV
ncbi:MAG: hypothetical protein ACR2OZ_19495 [Verrucomicrobiales bacterium]